MNVDDLLIHFDGDCFYLMILLAFSLLVNFSTFQLESGLNSEVENEGDKLMICECKEQQV